jgi:hypothetical protein
MTGLSPSAMLPLFYGAEAEDLKKFGFASDMQFAFASDITSHEDKPPAPRNLFGPACPADIYRGQGPGHEVATRNMLKQLAIHMKTCAWPGANNTENYQIPAGYTYLAQLAAHDLVDNIGPLPRLNDIPGYFARDYRTGRLVLDTIYGGGPAAMSLPYEIPALPRGQRHRLRLGHVPIAEPDPSKARPPPMMCKPALDIGRAACPFLSDDHGKPIIGVPDALVADPRNDDHVIISQMTALFHRLHNVVDCKLGCPGERQGQYDDFVTYRQFLSDRKIVAMAYRSVIINDLLCKLLDPGIYHYYKANTARFLDSTDDNRVPLEFSHAVYRFGHAMTQSSYVLNDKRKKPNDELLAASMAEILDRSSARNAERLPVAWTWLIDWSRFFDLGDQVPLNFSSPIRPNVGLTGLVGNIPFYNEDAAQGGIFYRDLIRGADAGVRTVDSIIQHLRPQDRARSRLLNDRGYRQEEILKWLTQCCGNEHAFCAADRFSLTRDPPLLFFVLFEAAHTQDGERLGILGSVVVAEVFFAAYKRTFATIEGERDPAFLTELHKVFPDGVPSDMPALIRFVQSEEELAGINCPG